MRFKKKVTEEEKEFLTELLKQYKSEMPMSDEVRKELHKWVAAGNSPYENGSMCYGAGGLIDFITAFRSEKDRQEWFDSLTPEEQYLEQFGHYPWEDDDDGPEWAFELMESFSGNYISNESENYTI